MAIIPLDFRLDWSDPSQPGGEMSVLNNNANTATSLATQYTMADIINTVSATGGSIDGSGVANELAFFTDSNTISSTGLGIPDVGYVLYGQGAGSLPNWNQLPNDIIVVGTPSYGDVAVWQSTSPNTLGLIEGYYQVGDDIMVMGGKASGVGNDSTGFGIDVLEAATGGDNTAFGHRVLKNSTGSDNTGVGESALYDNTSGADNTAVGASALENNTSGSDNTCIGKQAGSQILEGSDNTCIGNFSGASIIGDPILVTGMKNTCLGSLSGGSLDEGNNNTLIGYGSAPSANNVNDEITLGDSNITALRCAVNTITLISDERDKKDIIDIEYGLDFINTLKPRQWTWDHRPEKVVVDVTYAADDVDRKNPIKTIEERTSSKKGTKDIGFVAQELQGVDNEFLKLVNEANPEQLQASWVQLVPVLVKAIQELSAKVTTLENK